MIKLTIGNSMSQVEGADAATLKALRKATSYSIDPKQAHFSNSSHNTVRYLMDKKGHFPTGLLYIVENIIPGCLTIDNRRVPEAMAGLFKLSLGVTPYPEQIAAAEACALEHRGVVSATTGVGKSLMAALIVDLLQVPTLIVVPSLELKRQLTQSMSEWFGTERVGDLGSPLAIENVDALDPDKPLKGYGCVIIDEFHHSGAKTYRILNQKAWGGVYYRFGLTATPFRAQEHERLLLESVLSKVIYRVPYAIAVDRGFIVPVEAYYIELPKTEGDAYTWPQVYSQLIVNHKHRNAVLATLMHSLWSTGQSALCLVKEIAHGHNIKSMMPGSYVRFANGKDEETPILIRDFNRGSGGSLIGTTGVVGEGVDTKPAEWIIIAGLGKSRNQLMQQIGRGVRRYPGKESCKVILVKDSSHKFTLAHFKEQCKILKEEYGVVPVKLDFNIDAL